MMANARWQNGPRLRLLMWFLLFIQHDVLDNVHGSLMFYLLRRVISRLVGIVALESWSVNY